jgi:hypothetical protein
VLKRQVRDESKINARVRGMRISQRCKILLIGILCGATLSVMNGCDDGTYSKRFKARLTNMATLGAMDALLGSKRNGIQGSKTDVRADFRAPRIFDEHTQVFANSREKNRAEIPGLQLAGFLYSMERRCESTSGGSFLPVYTYVYAVPKESIEEDAFRTQTKDTVDAQIAGNSAEGWTAVEVNNLDGTKTQWWKLRVSNGQPTDCWNFTISQRSPII